MNFIRVGFHFMVDNAIPILYILLALHIFLTTRRVFYLEGKIREVEINLEDVKRQLDYYVVSTADFEKFKSEVYLIVDNFSRYQEITRRSNGKLSHRGLMNFLKSQLEIESLQAKCEVSDDD